MEGQRPEQGGGEEREFRELLSQITEIIRELGERSRTEIMRELEERYRGVYTTEEERGLYTPGLERRVLQVIVTWRGLLGRLPVERQEGLEMQRELHLAMMDVVERFPEFNLLLLHADELLLLPRITIADANINSNNICIVCQQNFLFGEVAREFPCGHRLHETCIIEWAPFIEGWENPEVYPVCPVCRPAINRQTVGTSVTLVHPVAISSEHISDSNSITSSCPICYDNFQLRDDAVRLHCGHIFHQICIAPWRNLANTCPVCRREFQ